MVVKHKKISRRRKATIFGLPALGLATLIGSTRLRRRRGRRQQRRRNLRFQWNCGFQTDFARNSRQHHGNRAGQKNV